MKNNNKKVLVLLAYYNGDKYIKKQIYSILKQKNCCVDILISDDGSTDSSLNILDDLSSKHPNIKVIKNTSRNGFSHNFYNLFYKAKVKNYDFIALSDQDDIFSLEKFHTSINHLSNSSCDAISSSVKCFGNSSRIINQCGKITNYDFFFEGAGQGNTFLMKKNFFYEFQIFFKENHSFLSTFYFHDWLIYIFCRARNHKWLFCKEPLTFYRIHNNNTVGDKYSIQGIWLRLKKIFSGWYFNQIFHANKIARLVNPSIVDLESMRLINFIILIIVNGRRKISDRILLLFSLIFLRK